MHNAFLLGRIFYSFSHFSASLYVTLFRELLIAFRKSTGHKPHRIIFYRYDLFFILQNWISLLYLI
jgi:hypothetical protein